MPKEKNICPPRCKTVTEAHTPRVIMQEPKHLEREEIVSK